MMSSPVKSISVIAGRSTTRITSTSPRRDSVTSLNSWVLNSARSTSLERSSSNSSPTSSGR